MKREFLVMVSLIAVAISTLRAGPAQAQNTTAGPFEIVEATIDDIHMAFRFGTLTAPTRAGLPRSDQRLRQARPQH